MALTKCSECSREISTQAKACPHCGCPITSTPVHGLSTRTLSDTPDEALPHSQGAILICSIALLLICFVVLLGFLFDHGCSSAICGVLRVFSLLIPAFAIATIVAALISKWYNQLAQSTGAIIVCGAAWALAVYHGNFFFACDYLMLITGLLLLVVAPRVRSTTEFVRLCLVSLLGIALGAIVSYWFQPGAVRIMASLPSYLTEVTSPNSHVVDNEIRKTFYITVGAFVLAAISYHYFIYKGRNKQNA